MNGMVKTSSGYVPNDRFLYKTILDVIGHNEKVAADWIYNILYGDSWKIERIESLYQKYLKQGSNTSANTTADVK